MSRPRILDEQLRTRIVEAVRAGAYRHDAAAYAGIHRDTLWGWLARGRAALDRGQGVDDPDWEYGEFADAVERATAEARVEASAELRALMTSKAVDPQVRLKALTWWLERSDPEHWARANRPEQSAPGEDEARRALDQQQQGAMLSQALRGILLELGVPLDASTATIVRKHLISVVAAEQHAIESGVGDDE